jgi:hypothetical protein
MSAKRHPEPPAPRGAGAEADPGPSLWTRGGHREGPGEGDRMQNSRGKHTQAGRRRNCARGAKRLVGGGGPMSRRRSAHQGAARQDPDEPRGGERQARQGAKRGGVGPREKSVTVMIDRASPIACVTSRRHAVARVLHGHQYLRVRRLSRATRGDRTLDLGNPGDATDSPSGVGRWSPGEVPMGSWAGGGYPPG